MDVFSTPFILVWCFSPDTTTLGLDLVALVCVLRAKKIYLKNINNDENVRVMTPSVVFHETLVSLCDSIIVYL